MLKVTMLFSAVMWKDFTQTNDGILLRVDAFLCGLKLDSILPLC